jgi:SAM-dependent methyltransferase
MPDAEVLAQMYGTEYAEFFHGHENMGGSEDASRVIEWLRRVDRGTFVDYGCGAGHLLREAGLAGWRAIGVEFDEKVASEVAEHTGAKVISAPGELISELSDVLHLGDVIEHLTEVNRQVPEILRLLKPGGLLLAQGPLENNPTLFNLMVRLSRTLRMKRTAEMAPYHVMLATAEGQREFFRRFGLEELEYSVREVAWPAPCKISFGDLRRPRLVGLFILHRVSQAASALRPRRWGNRYFYVGRRSCPVARDLAS